MIFIPLASTCNFCVDRREETLDCFLSAREVACMVSKKATSYLRLINIEIEPWRVKISKWFIGARKPTFLGQLLWLFPMIITWRLWLHRCKAWMENAHESGESIWLAMQCWITHIVDGLQGMVPPRLNHIFSDLQVKSPTSSCLASLMLL